jgi:hypothetical protein
MTSNGIEVGAGQEMLGSALITAKTQTISARTKAVKNVPRYLASQRKNDQITMIL